MRKLDKVFQLRANEEILYKLRQIAAYNGVSASAKLVAYINASYSQLPKEEK
jgi:hypothetical protein